MIASWSEREQLAALKTVIGDAKQQEEALQRSVDGESRRAADAESRLRLAEEALRGREKNARNNASSPGLRRIGSPERGA